MTRSKRIIGFMLCAYLGSVSSSASLAQEAVSEPAAPTISKLLMLPVTEGSKRDDALMELTDLERLMAQYASDADRDQSVIMTSLCETHSILGNHRAALRIVDERDDKYNPDHGARVKSSPGADADIAGFEPVVALTALDELAAGTQVVMINEAHHMPLHRSFTLQALKPLRKKGFTYFAAEAFAEDTTLRQRGYPVFASGHYTREPVFAEMVRTAIREGYQLVRYETEQFGGGIDAREQAQARNLIERILKLDPKAKIVVHAGYGHIREFNEPQKWMAQYFKEWSGIDPLTIDQTNMMEHYKPEYENPLYQKVLQQHKPVQAIVLRKPGGGFWTAEPGSHDLTVFHPRTEYRNGRPAWLALQGTRRPYPLQSDICAPAQTCLVQAKSAAEGDDAIAVDQIQVQADTTPATLMLPAGAFNVIVLDAVGTQLRRFTIRTNQRVTKR